MNGSSVLWIGQRQPHPDEIRLLAAAGYRVTTVGALSEALPLLATNPPDVTVLALAVQEDRMSYKVRELTAHAGQSWVVAMVPTGEDVAPALAAGAHDAVAAPPGAHDALALRVMVWARAAARVRDQSTALTEVAHRARTLEDKLGDLQRENEQLRELAHRDELTGLGNRRSFRAHLEYAVEFSRRYGGPVSVLVADLDGMKRLNDTQGHPAGDLALRRISEIFRASIRGADLAARLGGDEFAVVMPATISPAAARVADRIRARIETLLLPGGFALSASFGVATLDNPRGVGFAADELFARADAALYAAKRSGKNRVEVDGHEHLSMGAA